MGVGEGLGTGLGEGLCEGLGEGLGEGEEGCAATTAGIIGAQPPLAYMPHRPCVPSTNMATRP